MDFEIFSNMKFGESSEVPDSIKADLKAKLKPLVIKRAVPKRQITSILKFIDSNITSEGYLVDILPQLDNIKSHLKRIENYDEEITSIYIAHEIMDSDTSYFENEIEARAQYHIEIAAKLAEYRNHSKEHDVVKTNNTNNSSVPNSFQQEALPPPLSCPTFHGDRDKNTFKSFMEQFENLIGCKTSLSDSSKLQYLKSFLRGNAYSVIQHLSNANENYEIALSLLQEEFLDEPRIIHDILDSILKTPRFTNSDLEKVGLWISETRARVFELKHFNVDFHTDGSSGSLLMSHIISSKLPPIFLKELIQKIDNNYPTINDIFENFNKILKQLTLTKPNYVANDNSRIKGSSHLMSVRPKAATWNTVVRHETKRQDPTGSPKSGPSATFMKGKPVPQTSPCKFCSLSGHSMTSCTKYKTPEDRIRRCTALGLCKYCSSSKHDAESCPGLRDELSFRCFKCKALSHITALCTKAKEQSTFPRPGTSTSYNNLCINAGALTDQDIILPTLTLNFTHRYTSCKIRCLLDLGSQRSYLANSLMRDFGMNENTLTQYDCNIKTFNGEQLHKVRECALMVETAPEKKMLFPMLFSPLDLNFNVSNLELALENIQRQEMKLADSHFNDIGADVTEIRGLLGTDILQHLTPFTFLKVLNGTVISVPQGVIPFGHVGNYLSQSQLASLPAPVQDQNSF